MTAIPKRGRTPLSLALSVAAVAALLFGGAHLLGASRVAHADDKQWDSEKDNVLVIVPGDSAAWSWLTPQPAWKKAGIVKGARRELEKLKSGEEPKGQGGLLHVGVE